MEQLLVVKYSNRVQRFCMVRNAEGEGAGWHWAGDRKVLGLITGYTTLIWWVFILSKKPYLCCPTLHTSVCDNLTGLLWATIHA